MGPRFRWKIPTTPKHLVSPSLFDCSGAFALQLKGLSGECFVADG